MTTKLDAVLAAEVGDAVGSAPVPHSFFRMDFTHLHVVLSRDAVELFLDEFHRCSVADIALVHRHADGEIAIVGIFQALACIGVLGLPPLSHEWCDAEECEHPTEKDSFSHNH